MADLVDLAEMRKRRDEKKAKEIPPPEPKEMMKVAREAAEVLLLAMCTTDADNHEKLGELAGLTKAIGDLLEKIAGH